MLCETIIEFAIAREANSVRQFHIERDIKRVARVVFQSMCFILIYLPKKIQGSKRLITFCNKIISSHIHTHTRTHGHPVSILTSSGPLFLLSTVQQTRTLMQVLNIPIFRVELPSQNWSRALVDEKKFAEMSISFNGVFPHTKTTLLHLLSVKAHSCK